MSDASKRGGGVKGCWRGDDIIYLSHHPLLLQLQSQQLGNKNMKNIFELLRHLGNILCSF